VKKEIFMEILTSNGLNLSCFMKIGKEDFKNGKA
jgi:hypothetical protein